MNPMRPVTVDAARGLIDFRGAAGSSDAISEAMAEAQLQGTVALHNMLAREGFAYLADEVGMGKTYVALGIAALMRYANPALRVLTIAPRENIQESWTKKLRNFCRSNWRWQDQRVRTLQDLPAAEHVRCGSLVEWARQAVRRPDRDVFLRLTSFSFPLAGEQTKWQAKREEIVELAPLIDRGSFDLRSKEAFKDAYAAAINAVLPEYDLLIVDEAHNLKGGAASGSDRNRVLQRVLGTAADAGGKHQGKRFQRVLFLSATPLESDFEQLWNQLDLLGIRSPDFEALRDPELDTEHKQVLARRFLVRRLAGLSIGGSLHTKNMYRREWRQGGFAVHDEPLEMPTTKQRLIVALVQKKVAEVIHDERFGASFQMGMLASFESFVQTATGRSRGDGDDAARSAFDQTEQTEEAAEREGIDTPAVNQIADSYRRSFGEAMPHPKMDAVVRGLEGTFSSGEKALVFVRRIRSVTELREKLCDRYDAWFRSFLDARLEPSLQGGLQRAWEQYAQERSERRRSAFDVQHLGAPAEGAPGDETDVEPVDTEDEGGHDTFFSWFFRGEGPRGFLSGAAFRKNRLQSEGSVFSTFFEDNFVAWLLDAEPGHVVDRLGEAVGLPREELEARLRRLAQAISDRRGRARLPRALVFAGYQAAALLLLARAGGALGEQAKVVLHERFPAAAKAAALSSSRSLPDGAELLEGRTFFTQLRRRPQLARDLWPAPSKTSFVASFREQEQRRELLAAVARLGHAFVELWAMAVNQLGSLDLRRQDSSPREVDDLIERFLDLLEREREAAAAGQEVFDAFHELRSVGSHHDLILAVNFPDVRSKSLATLPRALATTLGRQTPVAGMHGGVSKTLVSQFRMPGYPLILVTTDVLQEGEDLHTFCSRVIHYGISWTPSAMEQRTGRVDRIGSKAHRLLDGVATAPSDDRLLQVHYPFLAETVEVLQVERVFQRMNRFLRTIHLTGAEHDARSSIDTNSAFLEPRKDIHQIRTPLRSAFEVDQRDLTGFVDALVEVVAPDRRAKEIRSHFRCVTAALEEVFRISWDESGEGATERFGTAYLDGRALVGADDDQPLDRAGRRQQPFTLYLRTGPRGHTLLHGTSPIGIVARDDVPAARVLEIQRELHGAKLCRLPGDHQGSYTLTAEADILIAPEVTQQEEVADLLRRILVAADVAERSLLPWRDQAYESFADSLRKEADRAVD